MEVTQRKTCLPFTKKMLHPFNMTLIFILQKDMGYEKKGYISA